MRKLGLLSGLVMLLLACSGCNNWQAAPDSLNTISKYATNSNQVVTEYEKYNI